MADVRELISQNKLQDAALLLLDDAEKSGVDIANEVAAIRAALTSSATASRQKRITHRELSDALTRLRYDLLDLLDVVDEATGQTERPQASEPRVFLSYNHADSDVVRRVKQRLEDADIEVRIDTASMAPGEDIRQFIRDSIKATDMTVCVISENSLLSGWVAAETVLTLADEELSSGNRFIACYLDDVFFQPNYRLDATKKIDVKIAEIDALILDYIKQQLDTEDINHEKSRLFDLRNNLGKVLKRLKLSLCLDIRDEPFDESMGKLVAELCSRD